MTDLNAIQHNTNWAHITITRLGEARNTTYRILPRSEAEHESEEQQQTLPIVNKYTRGKYGHFVEH